MNLEDAKRVADILQKIDRNNEIINNLKFKKTHDIRFGKGNNESTFIVCDKDFVDIVVKNCLHELTEEIWELEQELKLL